MRTNVTRGANFIEFNTAFRKEDRTDDGNAPQLHCPKADSLLKLLPLSKTSPIVTPEKHLKRASRPWRYVHERIC